MTFNKLTLPIGALALVLGAGGLSAEAGQRGGNREREDRGQARQRSSADAGNRDAGREQRASRDDRQRASRDEGRSYNNARPAQEARRDQRPDVRAPRYDGRDQRAVPRYYDQRGRRDDIRVRPPVRYDYRYSAPRYIGRRSAYPHYYGSGGRLSVYFGIGSGYRYGSPYNGRVYGYYPGPSAVYGSRRYFGDVRLQVRPRNAAVYVDGYYAGIVDDFDGVFQRLTLDVGPHQIEIEAPGLEPQVFEVYVDPTRTVDLHGDLYPER